jgi:acetyltransferase-like isoleucine patch superfamily enzyme
MRETIKALARGLALACVFPALISFYLRSFVMGRDRALEGSTQALALIPGVWGQYLRRAFLGRTLAACHPTATVCFGTIFSKTGARVAENVYIGPACHIGLAHIGRDVLLAPAVHVPSGGRIHGTSDLNVPIREQPGAPTVVTIGAGTWIGSAAVVMADVGRNSVVGAGAVVTDPLPDDVVAVGVPARVVRRRTAVADAPHTLTN